MSYIGRTTNKSSDIRRFNATSSTSATHTLTWTAPNEQSLLVTINGVKQQEDAYSVSGTILTLTSALVSTDKLEVIGINDIGTVITPAQNSVDTDKIQDDAVTAAKLANSINTEIAANTAKVTNATHTGDVTGATALTIATDAVDIAMLSATGTASATTFLRGDNSWTAIASADNTPAFLARPSADQSIVTNTWVKLTPNTEIFDTDGAYDNTTNYRFTVPSGEAGVYIFWFATTYDSVPTGDYSSTVLYVNGTFESSSPWRSRTAYDHISGLDNQMNHIHTRSAMMNLIVGDYVELWTAHNQGSTKTAENDGTYFGGMKLAGVNE